MPAQVKTFAKSLLRRFGLAAFRVRERYLQDGLFTVHSDHFRSDPVFRAAYQRGLQASNGVDPLFEWRVHIALWAAQIALRTEGDFVECGVNAGFISSSIMHKLHWSSVGKQFFLIDTFSGPVLAQYSAAEVQQQRVAIATRALLRGAYVTDLDRVRANFAEWGNAVVIQGAVPQVLHQLAIGSVAFLHIDMNCALPEQAALEFFWNRLSPGSVVLFDDYAYHGHTCQRDAIDSVVRARGAEVLSLPTGQGLLIK